MEKYLTPEQRKQQEEEARLEEERLARERGDNARERALDMMMGGVLEIKKEDELKKVDSLTSVWCFPCQYWLWNLHVIKLYTYEKYDQKVFSNS